MEASERELREKVRSLEDQLFTMASKLSQFNRVVAHLSLVASKEDRSELDQSEIDDLSDVVLGKKAVDSWRLTDGKPPVAQLVEVESE